MNSIGDIMSQTKIHKSGKLGWTECGAKTLDGCPFSKDENASQSHMILNDDDFSDLKALKYKEEHGGNFGTGMSLADTEQLAEIEKRGLRNFNNHLKLESNYAALSESGIIAPDHTLDDLKNFLKENEGSSDKIEELDETISDKNSVLSKLQLVSNKSLEDYDTVLSTVNDLTNHEDRKTRMRALRLHSDLVKIKAEKDRLDKEKSRVSLEQFDAEKRLANHLKNRKPLIFGAKKFKEDGDELYGKADLKAVEKNVLDRRIATSQKSFKNRIEEDVKLVVSDVSELESDKSKVVDEFSRNRIAFWKKGFSYNTQYHKPTTSFAASDKEVKSVIYKLESELK